jgi:hypothetical protein
MNRPIPLRERTTRAFCESGRRSALVLLRMAAFCALFLRAPAQTPLPVPTVALSPAPVITIDQMFFNFGKIRHGQTVVHGFKVSNTGQATLHIKEIHANCGCTSTLIGKMELAPGESTEIEAEFTPENAFSGAVRKTILVVSDAPAHPKLTLRFAADVLPDPSPAGPAP